MELACFGWLGIWHFLVGGHSVPGWLLVVLSLASLLFVWRVITVLRAPTGPRRQDYTEDAFFDLMWRWSYFAGDIQRPAPFCLRCDIQLVAMRDTEYGPWGRREVTHFVCDHCHGTKLKLDEPLEQIQDNVIRKVHRKLRNGEWKKSFPNSTNDA